MSDSRDQAMENARRRAGWTALIQGLILVVLMLCAFRAEVVKVVEQGTTMVQAAHVPAVPLLAGLLLYQRRAVLAQALRPGSTWGLVLIVAAIGTYALTTWPFYVGYVRRMQCVVALAGIALAVGGWRVLWRSLPIIGLVALALPIGWNTFSTLIIRPETFTLDAATAVLDQLPGTIMELRGLDMHYLRDGAEGVIALGDPHRGFAAPVAFLMIGMYVIFARVRPWWQVTLLLAALAPLMALGNLVRVVLHGWLTMRTQADPTDGLPRDASMVAALVLTFLVAWMGAGVLARLVVDADGADELQVIAIAAQSGERDDASS